MIFFVDIFHHGTGNAHPVIGACSAPDLIKDDETAARGIFKDICHFIHFHHEGALPRGKVITGADTGKDAVHGGDDSFPAGQEAAHLGHEDQQCHLTHIGRFPGHIRARQDDEAFIRPI